MLNPELPVSMVRTSVNGKKPDLFGGRAYRDQSLQREQPLKTARRLFASSVPPSSDEPGYWVRWVPAGSHRPRSPVCETAFGTAALCWKRPSSGSLPGRSSFPRKAVTRASEVAAFRGFQEHGTTQLQVFDDSLRSHREVFHDTAARSCFPAIFAVPNVSTRTLTGSATPSRKQLTSLLHRKPQQRFFVRHIGPCSGRSVNLRCVLTRECTAAVTTPAAVSVDDDHAAVRPVVAVRGRQITNRPVGLM